jgi:hypothetical protein
LIRSELEVINVSDGGTVGLLFFIMWKRRSMWFDY